MREAASRGFWVASRVPYGYRKLMVQDGAKKRPTLEPDAATSAVVERIFGTAEAGRGILDITRTLNDEGIANPTGRLWSKNGVHITLRNESYTGTLVWGADAKDKADPVRVEKAFPAIMFIKKSPNSHGFVNPRDIEQMWRDQFDYVYREYDEAVFAMTIHPDVSGRPQVLLMLERLTNYIRIHGGVRFCTFDEIVDDFASHHPKK